MPELLAPAQTGIPEDYMELLELYPWIKIQPHQWDGKTEAERLALVVEAARATVDAEELRLHALQADIAAANYAYDAVKSTPVFKLVDGNIPGVKDLEYLDETTTWDGQKKLQPFRIINPRTFTQGRAILAQMAAYDALVKERDDLKAQLESRKKK